MPERTKIIAAFLGRHGWDPALRKPLAGDGSFRHYDRLIDGDRRAVLMDAPPLQENIRPFVAIAELLYISQHRLCFRVAHHVVEQFGHLNIGFVARGGK